MNRLREIIEINKSIDDKDIEQIYDEAEQFYDWILEDKAFNAIRNNQKVKVIFTDRGKGEFFSAVRKVMYNRFPAGAASKIQKNKQDLNKLLWTVQELENIVKNAEFQWEEPNHKKDKKPGVEKYQHWYCPIIINGKRHLIDMVTERGKDNQKSHYYFHYLKESMANIYKIVSFNLIELRNNTLEPLEENKLFESTQLKSYIGNCKSCGDPEGDLPWSDATEMAQDLGYYATFDDFEDPEDSNFEEITGKEFCKVCQPWKTNPEVDNIIENEDGLFLKSKDDDIYCFYSDEYDTHYFWR